MKVIWFCNTVIPFVGKKIGMRYLKPESWITGAYKGMRGMSDVKLLYMFPCTKNGEVYVDSNLQFVGYNRTSNSVYNNIRQTIERYKPDVIHIFGTENSDALKLLKAAKDIGYIDRVVVNIQGLLSIIAKHYFVGLPTYAIYSYTLRDLLKYDNIHNQMKRFKKRGFYEQEVIRTVKHVIGRTDMDYAYTKSINPDIQYHFCNESLRPIFYKKQWERSECDEYSIFVSQSNYPIKGFHLMLEAMVQIVDLYPNAKLYTTGKSPLNKSFKERLKQTYYSHYIHRLILKYKLQDKVFFLGTLDERQMCDRFLKSHVFVCCSTIENSPNSLGEAMMLGVPVVSSDVGGVKNMLVHGKEGYLYQADAPYMLAHYVMQLYKNDDLACRFSEASKEHAKITHNRSQNLNSIMDIYNKISQLNYNR